MTEAKHTELPWDQDNYIIRHGRIEVCRCDDTENSLATDYANAEFIVRACNSYYDMLALVERVAELNKDAGGIGEGMLNQLVDEARRIRGEQ